MTKVGQMKDKTHLLKLTSTSCQGVQDKRLHLTKAGRAKDEADFNVMPEQPYGDGYYISDVINNKGKSRPSSYSHFWCCPRHWKVSSLSSPFHPALFHLPFGTQLMQQKRPLLKYSLSRQSKLGPTQHNADLPTSALWLAWNGFPSSVSSKFGFLRSLACGLRTASALPSRSDHKNSNLLTVLSWLRNQLKFQPDNVNIQCTSNIMTTFRNTDLPD